MTSTEPISIFYELINLPTEKEWIELKEAKRTYDFNKLGQYFSALSNEANLKGKPFGWLIFGVENDKRRIVGTNFCQNRPDLDRLKFEIAERTTNRITFIDIHELLLPEGRVIIFQIPAAPKGMPVAWDGHYFGRDHESIGPLNIQEIEQIRSQVKQYDWSAQICERATINDLDSVAKRPERNIKRFTRNWLMKWISGMI